MAPDRFFKADGNILLGGVEDEFPQNSEGVIPTMLEVQGRGRQSLYPENDRGGEELKVETEREGHLP